MESLLNKYRDFTAVMHWSMLCAIRKILFGITFLCLGEGVFAQTIDSLEWVVDGPARAVARITFNASVRFLRQAPLSSTDTLQVSFEINSNDDQILGQTFEEGKRLPQTGNKPDILLSYFPAPTVRPKVLTLRFDRRTYVLVRQGPSPRSMDLIFAMGDSSGVMDGPMPKMVDALDERRFALLLDVPAKGESPRIPVEFQDYAIFSQELVQDGAWKNGLALGYFKTLQDAEQVLRKALTAFPSAKVIDLAALAAQRVSKTQLSDTASIKLAFAPALLTSAKATAQGQSANETLDSPQYAVLLKKFSADDLAATPRIPVEFQDYSVFTRSSEENGVKQITLALGYFRTKQEADLVRSRALGRFPAANVVELTATPTQATAASATATATATIVDEPSQAIATPKGSAGDMTAAALTPVKPPDPVSPMATVVKAQEPATPAELPQTVAPMTSVVVPPTPDTVAVQVGSKGEDLLNKGRKALDGQHYQDAVDALNQALMLPPNPSSQDAQELIGFAWEGLNQPAKARVEYQLYLKLYPQSEHASKVAQRLEVIDGKVMTVKSDSEKDGDPKSRYSYSGSVSQYYYGGQNKTESIVNIAAGIDQNTLSKTNQSSLVTSVDLSGRYKTEDSDIKLVLRDSISKNFISTSTSQSVLSAAYIDYRNLGNRMGLRVGRQSAIGGSLFGLFDGVSFTMPVANQYKVSASLGVPANTLISAPAQRLAGVMVEADSLFEHWGGNISLIDQTTEGISDRRAMGLEVRYFGENLSLFSQLDYDLNFGALNAATLQSSMQGPYGTTITMLIDDRKAPSLQLSDALISSGATSLKTLLQLRSLAEVQGLAMDTTARAKQALLSVSRPLTPSWQGSMDFRYSDIGALPAVGNFQAMPATGAQYNFSLQLTGSNLYSERDINGFNVSVLSSDTLRGTQVAYNNLTGFMGNKLSVEPSLRLYTQTDNTSTKVQRISPGLRLSYKLSERASLLGETIYELSHTEGPTSRDDSSSYFFYMGYRYDFFR